VILHAVLRKEEIDVTTARVGDDAEALASKILAGLAEHDVLVTTGGASVGDHDLIAPVLEQLGATIHFHGVAQKPGKPMLFATLNGKPIVGLPGNPRAVLVLAWMYVLPLLRSMQRARNPWIRSIELPLASAYPMKGQRDEFKAALVIGSAVYLTEEEGSHMLTSMSASNALAFIPAGERVWKAGEWVRVYFPQQ
jgi:molybdopterin molybdotransferase